MDVADQEAWRQTKLRHFVDLFVMQNAAMFNSAAHGCWIEPLGFRLGKGVQGTINRRVSVGVNTDRPSLTQARFHRVIQHVFVDVGHATGVLTFRANKSLTLKTGSALV